MTDESFSLKPNFDAIRDFVDKHEPSTAFYTNRGLIPDDVICKVSYKKGIQSFSNLDSMNFLNRSKWHGM